MGTRTPVILHCRSGNSKNILDQLDSGCLTKDSGFRLSEFLVISFIS